jgi:hypothetical protein
LSSNRTCGPVHPTCKPPSPCSRGQFPKPVRREAVSADRLDLRDVDLRKADLGGASLQGAELHNANLQGAYLRGANLQAAQLFGANLQTARLHNANLREADLGGADLRGADFLHADLREADFFQADLRGADFGVADLRGAKLFGANLEAARLHTADLRGRNSAARLETSISTSVIRQAQPQLTSGPPSPTWRPGTPNRRRLDRRCPMVPNPTQCMIARTVRATRHQGATNDAPAPPAQIDGLLPVCCPCGK